MSLNKETIIKLKNDLCCFVFWIIPGWVNEILNYIIKNFNNQQRIPAEYMV